VSSPFQIDGGHEVNGWYLSNPVADKSYWWVLDDEYIIASRRISGYQEVEGRVLKRWLPLSDGRVVALQRAHSGH
jgi:hypothetical protein